MTEIKYNIEQMKADLLAILNEKKVGWKTTLVRQQVKDKAAIPSNDREGSALLDKIFRDLEEEKFIRQEGSLTELTVKGTEAANHKNGYIGYQQGKIEEEKIDKILERLHKIVPILLSLVSIITAIVKGIKSVDTQFWIGMVIGISITFILQYSTKITKFLVARV